MGFELYIRTPIKMYEYNERIDLDESTIDISSLTELIENADIDDITDETSEKVSEIAEDRAKDENSDILSKCKDRIIPKK